MKLSELEIAVEDALQSVEIEKIQIAEPLVAPKIEDFNYIQTY